MRTLICSLNSTSFVNLTLGFGLNLRARGHNVAVVTDLERSQEIECHGLVRIPRGDQDGASFQTSLWGMPLAVAIQVKHLEYAIKVFQPDILVGQQLTLGAYITAERYKLPLAVWGLATYLWPSATSEPVVETQDDHERKVWRYTSLLSSYNEIRALFRLPLLERELESNPFLGDVFMLRTLSELEGDIKELPRLVHLVGPCVWEDDNHDPELERWLTESEASASSIIYVHQGRYFDYPHFWPKVVDAFRDTEIKVIAATSGMDCAVGELPSNFFVRPRICESLVFRYARAMIASGNTTAVLGALIAGVPAILIPAGGEQPDVAERCRIANVARVMSPADASPRRLWDDLALLMADQTVETNAKRLSRSFSALNTFDVASSLVEHLAAKGEPVLRMRDGVLQESA